MASAPSEPGGIVRPMPNTDQVLQVGQGRLTPYPHQRRQRRRTPAMPPGDGTISGAQPEELLPEPEELPEEGEHRLDVRV